MTINRWHRNYLIRRYLYGPCLKAASHFLFALRGLFPRRLYALSRPIFVIGCSRSGTSVFMDWFRRHPDLCAWSEAAQIMELDFYDPELDHLRAAKDATAFEAFRIALLFGMRTRLEGKKVFATKHPENSFRIAFIQAIFPDAAFIHVMRDGCAVAVSNYHRTKIDPFRRNWPFGQFPKPPKWREYLAYSPIRQFALQWVDTILHIRKAASEEIAPENYLEVSYEEFCRDPAALLARVDTFCRLDPARRGSPPAEPLRDQDHLWRRRITEVEAEELLAIVSPLNAQLGFTSQGAEERSPAVAEAAG